MSEMMGNPGEVDTSFLLPTKTDVALSCFLLEPGTSVTFFFNILTSLPEVASFARPCISCADLALSCLSLSLLSLFLFLFLLLSLYI